MSNYMQLKQNLTEKIKAKCNINRKYTTTIIKQTIAIV